MRVWVRVHFTGENIYRKKSKKRKIKHHYNTFQIILNIVLETMLMGTIGTAAFENQNLSQHHHRKQIGHRPGQHIEIPSEGG